MTLITKIDIEYILWLNKVKSHQNRCQSTTSTKIWVKNKNRNEDNQKLKDNYKCKKSIWGDNINSKDNNDKIKD